MKKLLLYIAIFAFSLTMLVGCDYLGEMLSKEPISSNEFNDLLSDKDFQITDITNSIDEEGIESAITASSDGMQLDFYVLSSDSDAKKLYNNNVKIIEKIQKDSNYISRTSIHILDYEYHKLVLSDNDEYYIISRIKNTILSSNGSNEYEDTIKEIYDELGY